MRRAGLLRVALAAVAAIILFFPGELGGWASYLTLFVATVYGVSLASRPGTFVLMERDGLWIVAVDVALISLLVADTGGVESPFSALYLLAAFGAGGAFVPSAALAVAGYLAALAIPASSLSPLISPITGLYAALIVLAFYLAGNLGAKLRDARERSEANAAALAAEESYVERLDAAVSRLGSSLGLMRPEDVLQWAVEAARDILGATYAHAALPEGNLHRTTAEEELEACPSWWHPEIQRLVLWSARSGAVLHEESSLPGINGLVAVPIVQDKGQEKGTLLVGGCSIREGEERILHRIALEAARALADRESAPGGWDPISRLPNRASLMRVLQQERCYEGRITLLHVGLEGLERYRKVYGLPASEDLLRRIGARLVDGQHRVFQASAEEFTLLVSGGNGTRAHRAALSTKKAVDEATREAAVSLTSCVGIVPLGGSGNTEWTPDEALDKARRALQRARQSPEGAAHAAESDAEPGTAGVVYAFVQAAEAHDSYLGDHLRSVSQLARELGKQLGLSELRLDELATGALLHDVGKIGLPQSLLRKPGSLDDEEYEQMKLHPELGVEILEPIQELSSVLPVVKYHHERYDGGGYPKGLKQGAIPLEARITLVADALDSMIRDRSYRKGRPLDAAVQEINASSGTQFDPEVVSALLSLLESGNSNLQLAN